MSQRSKFGVAAAVVAVAWWLWGGGQEVDETPRAGTPAAPGDLTRHGGAPAPSAGENAAPVLQRSAGEQFRFRSTAARGRVIGRVRNAQDKQLVPYVDVTFRLGRAEQTANSGPNGEFEIELAPGQYSVRAIGEQVLAIGAPTLKVGSLQEAFEFELLVQRMATLRGRVLFRDGAPVGGAVVAVQKNTDSAAAYVAAGELAGVETNSSGDYSLAVPPGDVELRATRGELRGFARIAAVTAGEQRTSIDILLDDSAGVAGVVHLPDGTAAGGATVLVASRIPRTPNYDRRTATTDSAGRFSVLGVNPGPTVVEATLAGHAPSAPHALTLAVDERQTELLLTLSASARLAGRVVDFHGTPIAGAEVSRVWIGSKQKFEKTFTDTSGMFEFTSVGPGPHMVRARRDGYVEARLQRVMASEVAVELVMGTAGGLHGTVTLADGQPARLFTVVAKPVGSGATTSTRFFVADGRYEVYPMDPGRYLVFAQGVGGDSSAPSEVEVDPSGSSELKLELRRSD